ncbi:MAG: DUF4883 family protein [Sarcina sp.]
MFKKFKLLGLLIGVIIFFSLGTFIISNKNSTATFLKIEDINFKTLLSDDIENIKIVEKTFYSKKTVDKKYTDFFIEMLNNIDLNALTDPVLDEDNYLFKIYIELKDDKFMIDVYGDDVISIYPWDGTTPKKFVSISKFPLSIKAESLCNFIFKTTN